ncbi:hypothetical protein J3R83DRAFT_13812 [Lanmaoa asiatica]|nr:hypothetical protein J3R83DRAFT_13812 [Lanmaoa asiatica]
MSVLVPAKFPSLSAVFMAAAASILLLFFARILFLLMRLWSCSMVHPEAREKESPLLSLSFVSKLWGHSLQWNTLPASLPFTLALTEKLSPEAGNGVGVGLFQKRSQTFPIVNWRSRTGPQFQPPPPALYESPVPLSMAKMIMSRHVSSLSFSSAILSHLFPIDIPPTKSESVSEILYRLPSPPDITTADTFSPIPFNSIASPANRLLPKSTLHWTIWTSPDARLNLFYGHAYTRSRLRVNRHLHLP